MRRIAESVRRACRFSFQKNNLTFFLPVFSNPSVTSCHLVMLRDTAGGGVLYFYSTIVFNPLVLRTLPLYSLTETPRNATGRGRGRGLKVVFQFWYKDRFYTSPLCFATQNIGERPKKHLFLRRGVERLLFILLSSEKNEPRSATAVIGLFGSSPRSSSGSAELASLKQSSPFFLRLPCDFAAQ